MRRTPALVIVVGLLVGACGGDDGGGGSDARPADPVAEASGLAAITLVAPDEEGAGVVPTFEWEAVEGAAAYRLVVLGADGRPIWAWEGDATAVTLGAIPDRPEGEAGPVVTGGSTWSVAALDADGHVVALSPDRPVSP